MHELLVLAVIVVYGAAFIVEVVYDWRWRFPQKVNPILRKRQRELARRTGKVRPSRNFLR